MAPVGLVRVRQAGQLLSDRWREMGVAAEVALPVATHQPDNDPQSSATAAFTTREHRLQLRRSAGCCLAERHDCDAWRGAPPRNGDLVRPGDDGRHLEGHLALILGSNVAV